jgi:hypothetical protein
VKAACALAEEFDIQRMQRAADEWLTQHLRTLCSSGEWADELVRAHIRYDCREQLNDTRALTCAFPFLVASKEACTTVVNVLCEDFPEDAISELTQMKYLLQDATEKVAQLRAAQPRKELVRCL